MFTITDEVLVIYLQLCQTILCKTKKILVSLRPGKNEILAISTTAYTVLKNPLASTCLFCKTMFVISFFCDILGQKRVAFSFYR